MTRQYQYLFTTLVEPPGGEQVNAPLCIYIYIEPPLYTDTIFQCASIGGVPFSLFLRVFVKNRATPLFCIFHGKTTLSLSAIRFGISIEFSFPPPVRGIYFRRYVSPPSPRLLHCQSDVFIFSGNGIIFAAKEIDLDRVRWVVPFFLETFPRGMVFK